MAYNISVATHTDQERWYWVSRGVDILRDKGLRYNPDSVALYRQLSWTYSHKIGQETDDAHRFYKLSLALEWQELLGQPPAPGLVDRKDLLGNVLLDEQGNPMKRLAEVEAFAPIAEIDQLFFANDELSYEIRRELLDIALFRERDLKRRGIAEADDEILPELRLLVYARPAVFDRSVTRYTQQWQQAEPELCKELIALREQNKVKLNTSSLNADDRLQAMFPETADRLASLRSNGFVLNDKLLRRIGRGLTRIDASTLNLNVRSEEGEEAGDAYLDEWLRSTDPDEARIRDRIILPYLRAKVLRETYNMSPSFMFELMEGEWMRIEDDPLTPRDESAALPLPIDWRHPAAHGLYWSWRGVWFSRQRLYEDDSFFYELLNVYRMVIHNAQWLAHNGKLSFDPISAYYDWQPDPRMIELYLRLYSGHTSMIGGAYQRSAAAETFGIGREYFYEWSIATYWWYGYKNEAQSLFDELQRIHPDSDMQLDRAGLTLEQFVMRQIHEDMTEPDHARKIIGGLLRQWMQAAYANNQSERAAAHYNQAYNVYRYYTNEMGDVARMALPPWDQLVVNVCVNVVTAPVGGGQQAYQEIAFRHRFWRYAPLELKQKMWDRVRLPLYTLVRQAGHPISPEDLFPEPAGMEAWREANPRLQESITPQSDP